MANQSETGHAKNVANFSTLITVVNGFGEVYNPSKQSITPTSMASLLENAKSVMNDFNSISGNYGIAVANREVAFGSLSKLTTRVLNSLRSSDATQQIIGTAASIVRKIQGKRATPKKTEEEKAALLAEGTVVKEISSSQMSFNSRLDNFNKLIQLVTQISQYTPNEEELKSASLSNYYATLRAANRAAREAETALSSIRIARNQILYESGSGLVDISLSVKTYVKSLFGATSTQYRQVSGLTFKSEKL